MARREIFSQGYDIAQSAAIICTHCARQGFPILAATRDEPVDPADTGWQFHCNVASHDTNAEGKVWSIDEIVALDSTIAALLDNPVGVKFVRQTLDKAWSAVP